MSGSNHRGSICEFLSSRKNLRLARPGFDPGSSSSEKISTSRFAQPGFDPAARTGPSSMSLVSRLRSERPGFESGFGPTAMSEMARAVGLAQQRRNERCHGTTPTDVTDAEERPQLRHCAWSRKNAPANHDQHLSVVTRALLPTNCEPGRRLLG